jgi:anti-anti-sigma factor
VTTPAEIAFERRGASVVAHVGGEVDMTNAEQVRSEILSSVPNDALSLVVDLAHCGYLDSAAIEMLFDMARRLAGRRQDLRLVVPTTSRLRRVLELTDVGSAAGVHELLESAVDE